MPVMIKVSRSYICIMQSGKKGVKIAAIPKMYTVLITLFTASQLIGQIFHFVLISLT